MAPGAGTPVVSHRTAQGHEEPPSQRRALHSITGIGVKWPIGFGVRGYATSMRDIFNPPDATPSELSEIRDFYKIEARSIKEGIECIHADRLLSQ